MEMYVKNQKLRQKSKVTSSSNFLGNSDLQHMTETLKHIPRYVHNRLYHN